jgi:predicted ATPase/DNA-binding SARP family transcriptional activator
MSAAQLLAPRQRPVVECKQVTDSNAAAIEFRLLGPVEAVRNGSTLLLGGPRQRALLALLLVERGRPVSADRLAEELWQGRPPAAASTTLRSYISKLRSVLGSDAPIRSGPAGYALEIAPERVDAHRFEHLVREGEEALARRRAGRARACLREALELWQGRPFAELADDGALKVEARRLQEVRLLAVESRIEADLVLGRAGELVDELGGLVRAHPHRERLWRQLMLALYRAERQADALAAYQRARELLDQELGVEPSEELKRLEQAILRHEVEPARPPEQRHNLPAAVTSFVGREAELAEIERLLAETRLLTLSGVGGVGKTRLALEAAARALPDFPDGVYFVDFSALTDPALVPRHLAAALDVREQGDTDLAQLLVARVHSAEVFVLLDNCEHVREACAELAHRLLSAAPRLRVLATSRELLGAPGELDYPVPPLRLARADADPDGLRASEAVQLFLARARAARPQLTDDDRTVTTVAGICSELEGLPLALELAAARAKALSLEEIASKLSDRFRFLVSWRRLATARHRTLREAMDWSYELLTAEEQAVLARISVFAGGFTLEAAASISLDGGEERALELVERLVHASLVVAEERNEKMRYRLLETVRQYAAERLEEAEEAEDTRKAHARFFMEVAESAETRGAEQQRGLAQFDVDLDNMRSALGYAVAAGDAETELRLVGALWRYWWVRGYLAEGRERVEGALSRGADVARSLFNQVIFGAGILAWCVGDYQRGHALAAQLLTAATATGSVADEHAAYKLLGMITLRERDYATSVEYGRRTLVLAEKLGSEIDVLIARLNLAVGIMDSGKVEDALPMFEGVLVDYRRSGIAEGVGLALLNIGEATYILGQLARARESFDGAREAFESIGYRAHVGHALQGLAAVETRLGNHLEAARLLGRADSVLGEVGASKDDFAPSLVAEAEADTRAQLGEAAFAAAFAEGRQPETAIA